MILKPGVGKHPLTFLTAVLIATVASGDATTWQKTLLF